MQIEESKLVALSDEKHKVTHRKPESSTAFQNLTTAGHTDFHESSQRSEHYNFEKKMKNLASNYQSKNNEITNGPSKNDEFDIGQLRIPN